MSVVKSPRDIFTNYYDLLTYVIDGQLGALASDVLHVITLHEPLTLFEIAMKVKEQNASLSKDAFAQKVNAVETNIGTASSTLFNTSHTSENNNHNKKYNNELTNKVKNTKGEEDFTHLLTDVAIKEVMTRLLLHRCISYHRVERTYKVNRFASLLLRIAYPLVYHLAYQEFGVIGHTIISNLHQLAVLPFDVLMEIVHKQINVKPSLTDQLHQEHEHQQSNKSNYNNNNSNNNEKYKGRNGRNETLCIEEVNHVGRKLLESGWIELLTSTHHNASHDNYKGTAGATTSSTNKYKRGREDNAEEEHSNTEQDSSTNHTVPLSTPCQLNVFQIKLHFMEESIVELISKYYERESTHSGLHCAIIRVFFDALRVNLQEKQRKRRFESKEKNNFNGVNNEYTERLNNQDNLDNDADVDVYKDTIEFPVLSIEYIQHALQRKLGNVSISHEAIYNTLMQLYNTEHNCLQTFHGALQIDKNTNEVVLHTNAFGTSHDDNIIKDLFTENALDGSTMDTNNNTNNTTQTGSKRGKVKETSSKKGKEHKRVTFQNAQRALHSNSPQNLMEKCEEEKERRLIGIVRKSSSTYLHNSTSTSPALFPHENNRYKSDSSEFDFESEFLSNMHNNSNKDDYDVQYNSQWQLQSFTLNAPALINCLQAQVMERVIFARYGVLGIRIAKLLFAQYRWLEDKYIAEELIATLSHVREVLHGMLNDGYCLQQEVPRSSNVNERMIRSSVFLWGNESVQRIIPFIREHIAKSLHNALVKLRTLTQNKYQVNGTASINTNVIPSNVSIRLPEMNKLLSSSENYDKAESKVNSQVMERVIHQQRQVTSLQSCALSLIRMLLIMNL